MILENEKENARKKCLEIKGKTVSDFWKTAKNTKEIMEVLSFVFFLFFTFLLLHSLQ